MSISTQDAEAFHAALLAPAGSVVGFDGSQMNGRPELAAALAAELRARLRTVE